MLHVKRASAGSGKTYELAKMYIKLLLTVKEYGLKRRLRTEDSLKEALGSIMAVTFTVKATAEMKQRIVKNLAALANADNLSDEEAAKVDYLEEFIRDLGTNKYEIARLAKKALRHLLLHYSEFRVQTIDSFFQSVLHTFAYEASLDDNFNMELDSDYINAVGFDSALDSLSQKSLASTRRNEVFYWLDTLMKGEAGRNKWNVFARKEGKDYLYSELIKETANLEKEDFHKVKEELEDYFRNLDRPFSEIVKKIDESVMQPLVERYEDRKQAAIKLNKELNDAGIPVSSLRRGAEKRLGESLDKFSLNSLLKQNPIGDIKVAPGCALSGNATKELKKACGSKEAFSATVSGVDAAFIEWRDKYDDLLEYIEKERKTLSTWKIYLKMFPRLVIALEITDKKREFLDRTNTLQISDTAHLLSRIIDKDDTPFVYERLGSRLNHFLIDEFQDTSRMQWQNLYPLLANSESFRYDNLIIGDAKQSIYRFRNADYRLIQEVGSMFHEVVPYTSDERPSDESRENTNYRSKRRIVEFNNYVFSNIINVDKPGGDDSLFDDDVKEIYRDCVQALPPQKTSADKDSEPFGGYVELKFHPVVKAENDDEMSDGRNVSMANPGFKELTERIFELKSRGYDFRDIGILVQSHEQGNAVIKTISAHNNKHPENQIPVISEENLLVGSALSIRIIIHGLELATRGLQNTVSPNPVLHEPIEEEELFKLLKSLPTLALPALVEAIAEKFIPENLRNAEAPFLGAFQDAMLDYCASHPGDTGQFLKWWQRKSKTLCINSPEDSDGVMIQTIHKAKGLEYKCVIIPYAAFNFNPGQKHSEWRWVRPSDCVPNSELLPPYIPVPTVSELENTAHADIREKYCKEVSLDELNKMYVAFTRPVRELYIYLPFSSGKGDARAANILCDMLSAEESLPNEEFTVEEEGNGTVKMRYGLPASLEQVLKERKEKISTVRAIDRYEISTKGAVLQFEDGNKLLNSSVHLSETGETDLDPRTEGSLKHRVMQMVELPTDLKKALREMKRDGLITAARQQEWGEELEKAIAAVDHLGWFDTDCRIINERPILMMESTSYRPDRIIVDREGNATVVDYKFGARESKHRHQVKKYMSLLASTGGFKSVRGFLWYINELNIEEV